MKKEKIKYHLIDSEINTEVVTAVFDLLSEGGDHEIFLSSPGGYTNLVPILARTIDNYNERPDCSAIVVFNTIAMSSAFNLMFTLKPEHVRIIEEDFVGMIHFSSMGVSVNQIGKPLDTGDKARIDSMKDDHKSRVKFYKKIGINKKELKKYLKGKDVYLSTSRMLELTKKHNIRIYGK